MSQVTQVRKVPGEDSARKKSKIDRIMVKKWWMKVKIEKKRER